MTLDEWIKELHKRYDKKCILWSGECLQLANDLERIRDDLYREKSATERGATDQQDPRRQD